MSITLVYKWAAALGAAALLIMAGIFITPGRVSAQFGGDAFSAGDAGSQIGWVTPLDMARLSVFNRSTETQIRELSIVDGITGAVLASKTVTLLPSKGDSLDFFDQVAERSIIGVVSRRTPTRSDLDIIASLQVRDLNTGQSRLIASVVFVRA